MVIVRVTAKEVIMAVICTAGKAMVIVVILITKMVIVTAEAMIFIIPTMAVTVTEIMTIMTVTSGHKR